MLLADMFGAAGAVPLQAKRRFPAGMTNKRDNPPKGMINEQEGQQSSKTLKKRREERENQWD
jgi:hypothetical protein